MNMIIYGNVVSWLSTETKKKVFVFQSINTFYEPILKICNSQIHNVYEFSHKIVQRFCLTALSLLYH